MNGQQSIVGGPRRVVSVFLALLMVVGASAVTAFPAGALEGDEVPDWILDLYGIDPDEVPSGVDLEGIDSYEDLAAQTEAESAEVVESEGVPPMEATKLPEPGAWDVALGESGEVAVPVDGAGDDALGIAAAGDVDVAGEQLQIEVVDQSVADQVGASGFVFGVSEVGSGDSGVLSQAAEGAGGEDEGLPVELSVDYSGFAGLYGGGFVDRLQVVALPDCVLEDPLPVGCNTTGEPLPTTVNLESDELVVEVEDLAGLAVEGVANGELNAEDIGLSEEELAEAQASLSDGGPTESDEVVGELDSTEVADSDEAATAEAVADGDEGADGAGVAVFAVTAAVSGETGTYAASDMGISGDWQVSPGSGEFTYGHDIAVPAPGGGDAPEVGLSYSSGAVDGLTSATNPQGTQVGVGWGNFGEAFIERAYEPCYVSRDIEPHTPDLCWMNHNATLSLGGVSGPLIPLDEDRMEWRVSSDEGWRVERWTGADNGAGDGEHWKVTATDGTQYFFGLGEQPETGRSTLSALTVPVVGAREGEPCNGANGLNMCHQGWRWNLDRVVDPDGNVTTFFYKRGTNRYRALGGHGGNPVYDRSTALDTIEYGSREGSTEAAAGRVVFGRQYRCNDLNADCPMPTQSNGTRYPDVPNDAICRPSDGDCSSNTPSFFAVARYSHVKTEVRVGGEWRPVEQHNLGHEFWGMIPSHNKLYLNSIQQNGISQGGWIANEPTRFSHTRFANRVDIDRDAGKGGNYHYRITRVVNPFNGQTDVTYGHNRECAQDYNPPGGLWHANDRDCFPQSMDDNNSLRTGVFHKFLVTEVREVPREQGPTLVTNYEYEDDPAWAFNYGSFAEGDSRFGWTGWRGYGTAKITQGNSTDWIRVLRGMHGDPMWATCPGGRDGPCGAREESVEPLTGGEPVDDARALAGRTLEEASLGTVDGVPDQVVQSNLYDYEHRTTHEGDIDLGQAQDAEWAGVSKVTERVATAPEEFRERVGETTYNERLQPATTIERGWSDEEGMARCSITTYAENEQQWMFNYPATNTTVAGEDCESGEVLSASETYYDGTDALGWIPSRGNPTMERTQVDGDTWAETTTEFDDLGRPVSVTDPNGATATTTYEASPAHAIPTRTTVTNELGQTSTTDILPEFGVPVREEDANGNVSTMAYDELGRLRSVWLPTEQPSSDYWPSFHFGYHPEPRERSIQSMQLTQGGVLDGDVGPTYESTWAFYDGFWRERQVQSQSPESGKMIISDTSYDGRGLLRNETAPQAFDGKPGEDLVNVPAAEWDNRTDHYYDELGRASRQEAVRNSEVINETTYAYTDDTVTVTGPDGHQAREVLDGFGRTIAAEEHDGEEWVTSNYGYDLAGNMTSVADPEGNTIDYTYNMAGWRLSQDDPNRGTATFGYDAVGNQVSVADGEGNELHTVLDALGRATERRAGSPTGELLASWEYDTAPGGVGASHRETRYTDKGEWISETLGYDPRGRSEGTKLTTPDGLAGLSGEYTFTQAYDGADRVVESTIPEVGGLPAETLTTTYDNLGLARGMSGLEDYVWMVDYDDRSRPTAAGYGPQVGGEAWMGKYWEYNEDQKLGVMGSWVNGSAAGANVSRHELSYDDVGNLTSQLSSLNGAEWRECNGYDGRQRLVESYTVASGEDCADGERGGGPKPYDQSFSYSVDGNLTERTEDGETTSYTYPEAGGDRPHAPTEIGGDSYTWDANGNLAERTVEGGTETFNWDVEQMLTSVEGPEGTTEFTYDASGQRLLRETDEGTTLYIAGHEVTASADGSSVTGVRSYTFGGDLVATRTTGQGVAYMVSDEAGSVEAEVESEADVTATRLYEPYGEVRDEEGEMATDQGFVGQIEDSTTNLSYLNARYYDTTTGVFISTDPVYDTESPKTLNPYSYAGGNPTTFTDPSGLSPGYIFGMERENAGLRRANSQLRGHIKQLGSNIRSLQGVIKDQHRQMTKMMTAIRTLQAIVRQQQTIIRKLEARVRKLVDIVNRQAAEINRLRNIVARQQAIIQAQAAQIRSLQSQVAYWKGQAFYWKGRAQYWKGQAVYWKGRAIHWQFTAFIYGGQRNQAWADVGRLQGEKAALGVQATNYRMDILAYQSEMRVAVADIGAHESTIGDLEEEIGDLNDTISEMNETSKLCNRATVAGAAVSSADVGSNALNAIPGIGQIADWGADKLTDAGDAAVLTAEIQGGCISNAAKNLW